MIFFFIPAEFVFVKFFFQEFRFLDASERKKGDKKNIKTESLYVEHEHKIRLEIVFVVVVIDFWKKNSRLPQKNYLMFLFFILMKLRSIIC